MEKPNHIAETPMSFFGLGKLTMANEAWELRLSSVLSLL